MSTGRALFFSNQTSVPFFDTEKKFSFVQTAQDEVNKFTSFNSRAVTINTEPQQTWKLANITRKMAELLWSRRWGYFGFLNDWEAFGAEVRIRFVCNLLHAKEEI